MSSETLEELKEIYDNKPDGADEFFTHQGNVNYIDNHENGHQFKIWCEDERQWVFSELVDGWEYIRGRRSLSDIKLIIGLMENNQKLVNKINQFDKAITDIGKHIQKSEPSFCMSGVDIGDSQSKIIGYIKELEEELHCYKKGDL